MAKEPPPEIVHLTPTQLAELLAKLRAQLDDATYQLVAASLETLQWVLEVLRQKNTTLDRLQGMLFGSSTEKTEQIFRSPAGTSAQNQSAQATSATGATAPKRKGHGRHGAERFSGAQSVVIDHPTLGAGAPCPKCLQGKLYPLKQPARIVCIMAQPIFPATVYLQQKLRCHLCGALFSAPVPEAALLGRFDPTVGIMLAFLRYGAGLPMYRIEKLQKDFGVPLPASTQWELIAEAAKALQSVYQVLLTQAAQGHLLYNDDTSMRVQSLRQDIIQEQRERTGVFTTSIVAQIGSLHVGLFFTGCRHAGENLDQLLKRRAAELAAPIQMCDALSRNPSREFQTLLANCLPHGRRQFVDIAASFPEECRHVLETLAKVFHNEAQAKEQNLSPEARLVFHQERSGPILEALHGWMNDQLEQKKVEPNSGLGQAIGYMLKHWPELTLFLRQPGAPLDNNICERALKMAILHRKNSLSYKTENGARVGDLFMSLIHTCRLNEVNPYDYLVALQRHSQQVQEHPEQWLPWNYLSTLARCDSS